MNASSSSCRSLYLRPVSQTSLVHPHTVGLARRRKSKSRVVLCNGAVLLDAELVHELAVYDPTAGKEFLLNAAGAGYVILLGFFLYRVLTKRAKRFREERIAGPKEQPLPVQASSAAGEADGVQKDVNFVDGLVGTLQSGACAAGLLFFTLKVDLAILGTPLPDQYTAHNIAVTVRTIIRGLCYLVTFIFSMNAVGLAGLTIKLLIDPDSVNNDPRLRRAEIEEPTFPKVTASSDPEEIVRALEEATKRKMEEDSS